MLILCFWLHKTKWNSKHVEVMQMYECISLCISHHFERWFALKNNIFLLSQKNNRLFSRNNRLFYLWHIWIKLLSILMHDYWSCRLTRVKESCHVKGIFSRSASHHISFCPSSLNPSQEPERNRVAPLRPIALRRSSQWRNHQILREKS